MKPFFRPGPLIASLVASLLAAPAHANVTITGTRILYPANERDVTVRLYNEGDAPALVLAWVDGGDPSGAVTNLNNRIDTTRSDAMGGVAAAMAVAGLPQSSLPGRTFMAISGSTYGGEYGSALGVSYMTKDGKWTVKGAVNTSSRGEVGAVIGGGFYW